MNKSICLYIANFIYKFGGTESYTANLIEALQNINSQFKITVITEHIKNTKKLTVKELADRTNNAYGTKISSSNFYIEYILSTDKKSRLDYFLFEKKLQKITKKYDIFFYCSRGLLTGKAKTNIAIIHFPMDKKESFPAYQKFKLLKPIAKITDNNFKNSYSYFIPNSNFTAYWLKEKWQIPESKIKVLYPPVTIVEGKYNKIPYSIFISSRIEKSKKIEELIQAYTKSEFLSQNCTLTIAGSIKNEAPEYKDYLTKLNPKVNFIFEPDRNQIEELYKTSVVFWHAKGYKESNPYNMEHFGITTVEAMSAGCIPVVINKAGQKEIVTDECGFKWDTTQELVSNTEYIFSHPQETKLLSANSIKRSKIFSKENYTIQMNSFINSLNNEDK